jgi:hypothetical protein
VIIKNKIFFITVYLKGFKNIQCHQPPEDFSKDCLLILIRGEDRWRETVFLSFISFLRKDFVKFETTIVAGQ